MPSNDGSRVATGCGKAANAIVDALGLTNVKKLTLEIEAREAVILKVERFVTEDELAKVAGIIDVTSIGDEWERREKIQEAEEAHAHDAAAE